MTTEFTAIATTCEIAPGTEEADGATVRIRGRAFTDVVESDEPSIAGTNRPILDIDLDPTTGGGSLRGSFTLTPHDAQGAWEGNLEGALVNGMVRATGRAVGTGSLTGRSLEVEFEQIPAHPGEPPCATPQAFFRMWGTIRG